MKATSISRRAFARLRRTVFGDYVIARQSETQPWHHLQAMRKRIVGGQLVVRFENIPANFTVDARSDLAARALAEGSYEQELISLLPLLPEEGDFINVGANVGIIAVSVLQSGKGRRVLCIEPMPECVTLLERNLAGAGMTNRAMVVAAAATAEPSSGPATLFTVSGRPEYTSGGQLVHASVRDLPSEAVVVNSVTIDEVASANGLNVVGMIMDCEGGEYRALLGARSVIDRTSPILVLELDRAMLSANEATLGQVRGFLEHYDYEVFDANSLERPNWEDYSGTVVAVPRGVSGALLNAAYQRQRPSGSA